ncbi:MAG: type II secretion system F family protein [Acidimicrobiales bacterium]
MTLHVPLVAACLSVLAAWSFHAWWTSQRVRARVATTLCSVRTSDDASRWPATVPPAAVLAGGAGTTVAVLVLGPASLAFALIGLAVTPFVVGRQRRARALVQRRNQLPQALERLAGALRSGSSLPVALGEAGRATSDPLGPELAALALGASRGQPMAAVLDGWAREHDEPGTRLAATALVLATVVGVAPARAVDGVASTLREHLELSAERRALASQARTSAVVLSAAPLLFALLLGMSDAAAGRFLLHSRAGWACLAAGLGLDAVGAWWMARLTRGERR